jgi:hypothetical protein
LTLVFLATPVTAGVGDYPPDFYFNKNCANETTLHYSTIIATLGCDYDCQQETSFDTTCANGCSTTLNACRPDTFTESMYFVLFILFLCTMMYVAWQFESAGVVLAIMTLMVSLWVISVDVFSSQYSVILYIVPFALMGFMATRYWWGGKRDKRAAAAQNQGEESRGEGE